jgi:hypothetical protein
VRVCTTKAAIGATAVSVPKNAGLVFMAVLGGRTDGCYISRPPNLRRARKQREM